MESEKIKSLTSFITIISVIVGVVISVLNFKTAKEKEAESRKIEAAKPFLELRQKLYLEALSNAAILLSDTLNSNDEKVITAKKRFTELYWGEMSLVEDKDIESNMIAVAQALNIPQPSNSAASAVYNLAHEMRESLKRSWNIDSSKIGKVNP